MSKDKTTAQLVVIVIMLITTLTATGIVIWQAWKLSHGFALALGAWQCWGMFGKALAEAISDE
jgi:hypothetical protein